MPESERQICQRLLDFRRSIKLSREALAEELGVTASKLKSYEYGRVPLPYLFAAKLCRTFGINPVWLVEGKELMRVENEDLLNPKIESEIRSRTLFSFAYNAFIKPHLSEGEGGKFQKSVRKIEPQLANAGLVINFPRSVGTIDADTLIAMLAKTFSPFVSKLPPTLRFSLFRDLVNASKEFEKLHLEEIMAFEKAHKPAVSQDETLKLQSLPKKDLTYVSESVKHDDVQAQLPKFIERLKMATRERGQKTTLAKYLGVPLASVSQWLSGEREPGGETTLRMLHWVEQQERQK